MCFRQPFPLNDNVSDLYWSKSSRAASLILCENTETPAHTLRFFIVVLPSAPLSHISTVRHRKGGPWKVIGYNHHHHNHHHHHQTHTHTYRDMFTHTHTVSGARVGFSSPPGFREERNQKSTFPGLKLNDGAAAAQTTGTLSKHLRLRWKREASPGREKELFL